MSHSRNHIAVLTVALILVMAPMPATGRIADPGSRSPYGLSDPVVADMLAQVDSDEIYDLAGGLSGEWPVSIGGEPYTIQTRYSLSGESIQKAADYLLESYLALGLEAALQEFTYKDQTLNNVVAEKKGSLLPNAVYLLTSHYDDLPIEPPAPGADDNASGTVGVLVAAEVLSQYDFGCTLRFVNFAAEEQGLVGSEKYAHDAYCGGEDIRGVINLDMIGWNSAGSPPEMELHAHGSVTGSTDIAGLYQEVVSAYGLDLEPTLAIPVTSASDHASFWKYGYPAILAIEDFGGDFNPNYHTKEDKLQNLPDLDYYTEMVKASLATFAHMGCLIEGKTGELTGTVIDAATQTPIHGARLTLINEDSAWDYTLLAETDVNGQYRFEAASGWHTLFADAKDYLYSAIGEIYINQGETVVQDAELAPVEETMQYFPLVEGSSTPTPATCP
jgi:hypothetical protein